MICFVPAKIPTGYVWNSFHIDDTGVLRMISTIGYELRFLIDICF